MSENKTIEGLTQEEALNFLLKYAEANAPQGVHAGVWVDGCRKAATIAKG